MKKILILSANPKDTQRIRLDEEVREIEEGLLRSKNRDDFRIHTQLAVRLRDLRRAMLENEPQIVHFSGHGEVAGIMLEDELGNARLVASEALAGLFELFKDQVVCVLLNSCFSEPQAVAINDHIPYVIGMSHAVPDQAALEFSIGFYDALGAGKSIEEAFLFGRNAIQLSGLPEVLTPRLLKKADQVLDHRRKQGGEMTSEMAIEHMLRFVRDNAQPGDWVGLNRLEAEKGNLLWAVREAGRLGKWRTVLEFGRALTDFLFLRGYWDEALEIGKLNLDAASRLGDRKEEAWCALYPLTRVYFHKGNYREAQAWSDHSLKLFVELQDDYGAAAACRYLGRAHQAQGDLDRAMQLYRQGLEKARQFNATDSQKNLQGHLLAAIASLEIEKGQFQEARQKYENALGLYRGTGDQMGVAEMLHQLGKLAFKLKRYNEAGQLYADSLKAIESIQAEQMEAEIYYSQAVLAEKQGFLELAEEKLGHALERFQGSQAGDGSARTEKLLARIRQMLGH